MISIITPSLNQGKYIERTIQSVLSQAIPNLEYIIIDGGSVDETRDILDKYRNQLRFISEQDRGQAHAVNKGLKITSGSIIGWINSDDVYYPKAIQSVIDFFVQHPDIDVVYGKANHIDQNDQIIKSYPTEEWNLEKLKQSCFLAQPAVFFRRRVIERVGLLDENLFFCMDYEYWLRLALNSAKFAYLSAVLAGSRLYPETKTVSSPKKATQETLMMIYKLLGYVPVGWLLSQAIIHVKNQTQLRMPQFGYIIAVFTLSVVEAFRWNGFLSGFKSCLMLPQTMLMLRQQSSEIIHDKQKP